ncbi:fatty acyl-CoA hydrolase precursor, medium chain [Dunckerocampus dactyliophorus]|uniref:fatty acyl-CoA hydrolase precursor, medium chain n=1 Tax=Dunckerocampus dactyliophorus TaxID=161453 RepID=UPI002404A130|nr:fatty acyl-CoA hydrolase precursor, medium chain [Dunckerocampus dactyliophorus]
MGKQLPLLHTKCCSTTFRTTEESSRDEHCVDSHTNRSTMKLRGKEFFCFLSTVLFARVAAKSDAPIVHTALGSLKGEYVSVKGKETGVYAYLGVPFAKPPVGPALRLAPPQDAERWEGVRDATKQPPMCIQHKQFVTDLLEMLGNLKAEVPDVSEDCLYLNIYTPASRVHDVKLPVMVWIHGGGFALGSASMGDGSALAAYQDVVVVLIQYRLGLLGFLSTGDEHMSGNFGLLDQVQALRWVQNHIHNFGGDPSSVTIFGESAGGVSVSLLLLSPLTDGLIHRAIAESGTAAIDMMVLNDPLPTLKAVANASGCSLESTQQITDCMRNLDLDTFLILAKDVTIRISVNVDGAFLTKPVDELFKKHEILNVPFMTGVTDHEGGFLLPTFMAPPNWTEGMDREQVVSWLSAFNPDPKDSIITDLMVDEYIGAGEDRVKNRDGFTELLGDLLFVIPALKTINAHRDAGVQHLYLYEYQHPPQFLQAKRPSFVGCDHGDDIFTVFGICFTTTHVQITEACPEEEEQFSRTVMSYWGNFARTGSPNGDGLVHWPKYGGEEHFLALSTKQVTGQHLKADRFVFMTQILPEKVRRHQEKKEHSEL